MSSSVWLRVWGCFLVQICSVPLSKLVHNQNLILFSQTQKHTNKYADFPNFKNRRSLSAAIVLSCAFPFCNQHTVLYFPLGVSLKFHTHAHTQMHTHTHTHTHIYIYIYIKREREKERECEIQNPIFILSLPSAPPPTDHSPTLGAPFANQPPTAPS